MWQCSTSCPCDGRSFHAQPINTRKAQTRKHLHTFVHFVNFSKKCVGHFFIIITSCHFEYRTRNTNFAYIFSPWNWEGLSRGWKDIFLWLLNGLTMIDLINCVRGSSSVLTKTLLAYILPVQTEQKRNVCYIAHTFQIWMKLTSKLCWTYKYTIHAHVYQQIYTKNPL